MGHIAKIGRKEDNHTCKQFASINFVFVYIKQVKRCLFFFLSTNTKTNMFV